MFLKKNSSNENIISYYIAISVILQIIDSMIPYPLFGIKLGLANVVPLFVLNSLGFVAALKVA
ncbi:MAG: Gx transporter family protein, partial [Endomicrobiia bacterium]